MNLMLGKLDDENAPRLRRAQLDLPNLAFEQFAREGLGAQVFFAPAVAELLRVLGLFRDGPFESLGEQAAQEAFPVCDALYRALDVLAHSHPSSLARTQFSSIHALSAGRTPAGTS